MFLRRDHQIGAHTFPHAVQARCFKVHGQQRATIERHGEHGDHDGERRGAERFATADWPAAASPRVMCRVISGQPRFAGLRSRYAATAASTASSTPSTISVGNVTIWQRIMAPSAHADQHGRHGRTVKHAQHRIRARSKTGPGPARTRTGRQLPSAAITTPSAQRGPSRVAACHRRVFDRAHVREGLRRDGDQRRPEHDLRNRRRTVSLWHGSSSQNKTNTADYRNGCSLKEKDLFFHSIPCYEPTTAPPSRGALSETPSEHFNGRHTQAADRLTLIRCRNRR